MTMIREKIEVTAEKMVEVVKASPATTRWKSSGRTKEVHDEY